MSQSKRSFAALASVVVLLPLLGQPLNAQESADESLKTLHPTDGLTVALWANEPMVNNPTSIDIDSRGRVWIAEGLNYRMLRHSQTLPRVEGADRIKILSDTNGDGKADKTTIFADNIFPVPMGLAIEEIWENGKQTGTRIYVGNSPDFLVLEDNDGDDKADHQYALLTGFRGVDSDHGLHGMTFGPDGKLYFTVGDARYGADEVQRHEKTFDVTDRSGRRLSASNFGTMLRVNRDGTQMEVLTSGHRNNYAAAVDSFGNMFGSDNDDDGNRGCRMFWVMDGGKYGYEHPDSTRHWAEELPGIVPKLVGTGNGAPGGLIVYEGDMLPRKYFGAVLQIDSGTHQVNAHPLHRHGAAFRSEYDVLLKGDDSWFRPIDLAVAPDGSVFVCDWYDAGVGGNRFSDQTTGRIYRISANSDRKEPQLFSANNPVQALRSPNETTRMAARAMILSKGADAREELLALYKGGRPTDRARALYVLADIPATGTDDTIAALQDPDAQIREAALQILARDVTDEYVIESSASPTRPPASAMLDQILPLAEDRDAGVRRALLLALRNVPTSDAGESLQKLTSAWDGTDRYYLEAVRAALIDREPEFIRFLFDQLADQAIQSGWSNQPAAVPPFFPIGTNDAFLRPGDRFLPSNAASRVMGMAWALRRVESLAAIDRILNANQSSSVERAAIMALASIEDSAAGRVLIERFFAENVSSDRKRDILGALSAGVTGPWNDLLKEPSIRRMFDTALKDDALQADAIEEIGRGRLDGFGDQLVEFARDESKDGSVRAAAISSLGQLKVASVRNLATEMVDRAKGKRRGGPVALASVDAIHRILGEASLTPLTKTLTDSDMPLDIRRRSLQLVTASGSGANHVISLFRDDAIPEDLNSELAFLLQNHANSRIRAGAKELLTGQSDASGNKIHDPASVLKLQGNAARGRQLFENHKEAACARCHRVTGEGTLIGPDLASVGIKYGDKELLYHIQNPSGAISHNFAAHTFLLDDGRVLNGLVVARQDGQITLGVATGQMVVIDADQIEQEHVQTVSLMPEGLVANFTEQELCDLIEYLLSLRRGDAGLARR